MATKFNTVAGGNLGTALGGAPADGDSVYIASRSELYNSGLALNADLLLLHVLPEFSGDIGAANDGSGLVADYNRSGNGKLLFQGSGRFACFAGYSSKTAAYMQIAPASGASRVVLRDWTAITSLVVEGGSVVANGDADANAVQVAGGSLLLQDSASTTDSLNVIGGSATVKRALTAGYVGQGGRMEFSNSAYALGAAIVRGGGTLAIVDASAVSGQIEIEPGGTLDLSRISRPLTIASRKGWPRSRVIMPRTAGLITWTATSDVGSGPALVTP